MVADYRCAIVRAGAAEPLLALLLGSVIGDSLNEAVARALSVLSGSSECGFIVIMVGTLLSL